VERYDLLEIYRAGLDRVDGARATAAALRNIELPESVSLVAIGKSATAMCRGAMDVCGPSIRAGLAITGQRYADSDWDLAHDIELIESGHPYPDESSLTAGCRLLDFLSSQPADRMILALISGGASSLVEVLRSGVTIEELQAVNRWLVASGLDIGDINSIRSRLSGIKGGRLRRAIGTRPCLALYISDVPDDDPGLIGSGLLAPRVPPGRPVEIPGWLEQILGPETCPRYEGEHAIRQVVVASLNDALDASELKARELGFQVSRHPARLCGYVQDCAVEITARLLADGDIIHLWGGEPTVRLPSEPGRGGRCQHLALSCALGLEDRRKYLLLCGASDGCDGTPASDADSGDAGALVDDGTLDRGADGGLDAQHCLAMADSGSFLAAAGDLISTGPTGTNVNDLVIGFAVAKV
jgi:hydroxypyruvate reductase